MSQACEALLLSHMAQRLQAAARGSGDNAHYLEQIPSAKENQKSESICFIFVRNTLLPYNLMQKLRTLKAKLMAFALICSQSHFLFQKLGI